MLSAWLEWASCQSENCYELQLQKTDNIPVDLEEAGAEHKLRHDHLELARELNSNCEQDMLPLCRTCAHLPHSSLSPGKHVQPFLSGVEQARNNPLSPVLNYVP